MASACSKTALAMSVISARVGDGIGDHAFEQVRGDDDRLDRGEAEVDRAALDDGQFLVGHLDAEIAARDHDAVGDGDDLLEILHRELVLDLGDDADVAVAFANLGAEQQHVGRLAHERHGDEIHAALEGDLDVLVVLLGQRGQVNLHAGQVDVAAAAERAGGEHLADELVRAAFLDRAHAEVAVVDDDDAADLDVLDELRVIAIDGDLHRALLALDGEADPVADLEVVGLGHVAGADGRALRVEQQRDFLVESGGDFADELGDFAHLVVVRVRHVEAKDVHAHVDEALEGGGAPGGGSEGGDDFGAAHKR